jgi:glycosyltransferase involved in cell wall biosynthesis
MHTEHPIVTVVTPSYNQGHFIRATIESVLSQGYPHLEYIVMDGGSTDETSSVVKDYASRLKFISEKDRGQSHAINKGFQMARGSILSWLNSDDLYLPGCIGTAVDGFRRHPEAGALYGEGYLIDRSGNYTGRFPCTEPFDLWKLTYLSDYILQQTVYFRKDVLDDVGHLDEDLHYTMDWDILIRIGMKYGLAYVPEYMGCLREYAEAKSSAGGMRRTREIREMLRRHTGLRISPGYIVYGLDTLHQLWCQRLDRILTPGLIPVAATVQSGIRLAAGLVIARTIRHSQGLFADGWAGRRLRYMLPPASGPVLIEGTLPEYDDLYGQRLYVSANGQALRAVDVPFGDFQFAVKPPSEHRDLPLQLEISALRSHMPGRFTLRGDRRRLAYQLKSIRRDQSLDRTESPSRVPVSAS